MTDITEITEWVIITILVTSAGMFVLFVGFVMTMIYSYFKKD